MVHKIKHPAFSKFIKTSLSLVAVSATMAFITTSNHKANAFTNNTIKKIDKHKIGNTQFHLTNDSDSNAKVKVFGTGIKMSIQTPNANQSSLLGSKVIHFDINPDKFNDETGITIIYHNGAKYGNKNLTTKMDINRFSLYKAMKNKYINVSTSLSKGLFYYGFTRLHSKYTFYNGSENSGNEFNLGSQSDPSYMTFNSLNGVESSTYANALNKNIGEWVRYANNGNSATGYVSDNTKLGLLNIGSFLNKPGLKGIGGKAYTPFYDSQGGTPEQHNSFLTHSVTFPAFSSNEQDFEFGASYGSAWYALSTNSIDPIKPPHKDDEKPDSNPGAYEKTVSKKTINKQGEDLTYTIKGNLPEKHKTYETHYRAVSVPYTKTVGKGKKAHSATYYKTEYEPYDVEINKHDSFNVSDTVPKDVSITSVDAQGIPKSSQSGNNLSFRADNGYMLGHSNRPYTIKIHAKANKLPKPTANGFSDSPNKKGWYYFKNKAHVNTVSYSRNYSHDTNEVSTRIKRIEGTAFHYDFDNNEDGDFGFTGKYNEAKNKNFDWDDNFNEDHGVIKKDKVYGYNNDEKVININKNGYKDNNKQWHYLYAWGNQNQEKVKLTSDDDKGSDYDFSRDYYFPYIVPRAKVNNTMIKVDTDKGKNNLPFQLIMSGESFLFREYSNYNNAQVNITATDDNGNNLYTKTVPLTALLKNEQDGVQYVKYSDKLNTSKLNLNKGHKLPIKFNVSISNPNQIQIDYDKTSNTFGFTASENTSVGNKSHDTKAAKKDGNALSGEENTSYFKNDENTATAPERTIKYDGVDNVRVLSEEMKLNQERYASAKTGMGMKNDLSMTYKGNLNPKKYMNEGTAMNYILPKEFIGDTNIKYTEDAHNHKFNNQIMYSDRLNQVNDYKGSNTSFNGLDTMYNMNSSDKDDIHSITKSIPNYMNDENYGEFKTTYEFYPRVSEKDNGNVDLAKNVSEPKANNDKGTGLGTAFNFFGNSSSKSFDNSEYRNGGNKFYTPYWLKLGDYPTFYDKAQSSNSDTSRLGGNWLNINELRPVNMYAHIYLASKSAASTNEAQDQLAFQPILPKQQKVVGFSNSENDWINNYKK
ncbi:hypothetical protein [Apilactobacillus timberlakei]|uniref:hypothetical protein n=1 Tax=Apilactobacillus timberlakei TaxID=2008380 RepID=UPI00112E7D1A|nr:hypothetical protein [Apilactobacillus timberlakei]TPR21505.1 hypothetical protein DY083_05660 [Apilactobacillus timberlakei]